MKKILIALFIATSILCSAQEQPQEEATHDLFDMSLEDLLNLNIVDKNLYLYGYINSNLQKTFQYPSLQGSNTVRKNDPTEWTPIRNFHLYGKGNLNQEISYLFNLAANDELLEIRNAWGNFRVSDRFQIRVGKMYRKFGLYNERLDQIPTFIGIEPPEMLDPDHLFLQRTTSFMLHGFFRISGGDQFSYALMSDNGENGPQSKLIPLGWDIRFKSLKKFLIVGASGYFSSVNDHGTTSATELGDGPPQGGILPWMADDKFSIVGFFIEKQFGHLLIQSEFYNARHDALRDPEKVLTIINEAGINANQRERFLGANSSKSDDLLTASDVVVSTKYNVQTWYVRLGYDIQTSAGQFVPYVFIDWMNHPENIQLKKYGGDEEAGLSDDGKFMKPSVGVVYRPIPNVAIKLDGSIHSQKYNAKTLSYPELRLDFSFAFSNNTLEKGLKIQD